MSGALAFARRHKWKIAAVSVVGGTSYMLWRALRGLPVRQLVTLMMQARAQGPSQVDTVLKGGEGSRLLNACLRDLRNDLAALVDVQEKQAAAKALEKHQVQERLAAFKELSVASLTRSIAAVYVVCTAQLLIHTQIFELVRLQRGQNLHEEAQRRFLSTVQRLTARENGPLTEVVRRVEGAVRRALETREQNESCDAAAVEALFDQIRTETEGARHEESKVREKQSWLVEMARELMLGLREGGEEEEAECLPWMGGEALGLRLEGEVRGQLRRLSEDMVEVVESDLFEEALAAALHQGFAYLTAHVLAKVFPPPAPPSAPDDAADGPSPGGGEQAESPKEGAGGAREGGGAGSARPVPLLKIVPVVSNLFMSIMHPERHSGNPYTCIVNSSAECKDVFEAVFTAGSAPAGPGGSM